MMWKKVLLSLITLIFAASLFLPLLNGASPLSLGLDLAGGAMVTYRPDLESVPERYADIPEQELLGLSKETLAGRLAQRFETLPDVVIRADGRIVVSLPGEHDQRRVLETLGETYRLTFRRAVAVHDQRPEESDLMVRFHNGQWMELGPELLDGDMLDPRSIRVDAGSGSSLETLGQGAAITFEFRQPYDEAFARITRESLGKTLAILLDDEVEWAGRVESEIRGPGLLRGGYSMAEATEVAGLLRSGNLPFSLEIESLTGVGPSLGQEMSSRGADALTWSTVALVLLLLLAYGHRPALLLTSWASLLFLLFSILGLIALFDLTVDLAAIAGLVLSVGMGMDAFILIFEALEGGKFHASRSPLGRLREVYGWRGEGRTILHANATTFLVVLLLFVPDRLASFALFLVIGILASLLTLLLTQSLLAFFARRGWLEESGSEIPSRFRHPLQALRRARPRLFRWRRAYFALLAAALIASGAWFQMERGGPWLELGADFEPGMQWQISLSEEAPVHSPEFQAEGSRIEGLLDDLQGEFPQLTAHYRTWQPPGPTEDGLGAEVEGGSVHDPRPGYLISFEGRAFDGDGWRVGDSPDEVATTAASSSLSPERLVGWLKERDITLHGIYSVDARLSSERIFTSLSILLGSFVLLALYLRYGQGYLDGALVSPQPGAARSAEQAGGRIFVGTILAVILDIAVVLTTLAWLEIPIGMPVIAAILTIIGYSVNDSMVLWSHLSTPGEDGPKTTLTEKIEIGVDRILSRTLLTSLSTMAPAIAILATGLEPLRGFAWAVLVGTVAGTLSSLFVVASFAAPKTPRRGPVQHPAESSSLALKTNAS